MISVVVPVYNNEVHLQNLFDCFDRQSYRKLELIFVDDGSSDQSFQILDEYCSKSNFSVKLLRQTNSGVSAARNAGMNVATAEYLTFIDADDMVSDDYFKILKESLEICVADVVFCNNKISGHYGRLAALRAFLYGELKSGVCFMLVKRHILEQFSITFANGYKYSEDLHMVWRVLSHCERSVVLDRRLYYYKNNEGSAMGRFDDERFHGVELMKQLESYFEFEVPEFSAEYKRYAVARIYWAITRQACLHYSLKQFISFLDKYGIAEQMKQLLTFPIKSIAISSRLLVVYPKLFYFVAKLFSLERLHLKWR